MKPQPQGRGALLEDRPGQRIDMVPAVIASKRRAATDAIVLTLHLAPVAHRPTLRPTSEKDVDQAGVIGWEFSVEILDGVLLLGWNYVRLFALCHDKNSLPYFLLVVKG